MRRRTAILGIVAAGPALTSAGPVTGSTSGDTLVQQVSALVVAYEAAWNNGDLTAMGALYAPNIHWVNIMGMHWRGFEEVDYAHRALLERTFKDVGQTLEEIESIQPVPGGGAVAVVRWAVDEYTSPSGQAFPASRTRMSLTLMPAGDRLLIAHGANIQIVEAAQRSDPVVQRRERKHRI